MITDAQVEQLKKLKELADMGILTQEEFDAKKQLILAFYQRGAPPRTMSYIFHHLEEFCLKQNNCADRHRV